jgi:hypothetical protein
MLETFHRTTRRHLNIYFCEDLHCSFLLRRGTLRGRQILKKESGWLLVQVGVGFGIVRNVSVKNAILDRDAEYYCRNVP